MMNTIATIGGIVLIAIGLIGFVFILLLLFEED